MTFNHDQSPVSLLTSWVSQATFSPPGLTLALSREQAETLLPQNGMPFVLNILKEGRNVRRVFQRAIAPGENRLADLATHPASNGCLVLDDALAYLECHIQNRMECHDHWLLYATIDNGKVLESVGLTAIQHRKSANYS
jgi:flavin reductase (DIM6/NTAB) family NADH-FMN oxidoreductase RutF